MVVLLWLKSMIYFWVIKPQKEIRKYRKSQIWNDEIQEFIEMVWVKNFNGLIPIITGPYTANDYRQTTDKLIFKSVISTQRYLYF